MRFGIAIVCSLVTVMASCRTSAPSGDVKDSVVGGDHPAGTEIFFPLLPHHQYSSMIVHEGALWVGLDTFSAQTAEGFSEVLVFKNPGISPPERIKVRHAPQHLYPAGPGMVAATGLSLTPEGGWQTHFSLIDIASGNPAVRTTDYPADVEPFPVGIHVKQWATTGGKNYFTLRTNAHAIMVEDSRRSLLPLKIHTPDVIIARGRTLYVEETDFADTVVRYDLDTGKTSRAWPLTPERTVEDMLLDESGRNLWVTLGSGAAVIDTATMKVASEIAIAGRPQGMTQWGQCVVAALVKDRSVIFMRRDGSGAINVVKRIPLASYGTAFEFPRSVAFDSVRSTLYVRSAYACVQCDHSPNALMSVRDVDGSIGAACGK